MVYTEPCPRCKKNLEPSKAYCTNCGLPLNAQAAEKRKANHRRDVDFMSAFQYPLRGSGLTIIVVGCLFFAFLGVLPLGGLIALAIWGYVAAFMFKVLRETGRGNMEPVDWPDFTNIFDDIIVPAFQMIFVYVFCFAPAVLALYFGLGLTGAIHLLEGSPTGEILGVLLLAMALGLGGLLYLPMALLCVGMNDSIMGVFPPLVLRMIQLVFKDYLLALTVLALSFVLNFILNLTLGNIPFMGGLLSGAIGIYTQMVNMHVLGLIYYKNRDLIGVS